MIKQIPYCLKLNRLGYKFGEGYGINSQDVHLTDNIKLDDLDVHLSMMSDDNSHRLTDFLTFWEIKEMLQGQEDD